MYNINELVSEVMLAPKKLEDNISYDRKKLILGINKVCDAVKITLGSAGSNAILEEELYPFHIITNDGISIADKIKLIDSVENIGANLMKEVAKKANRESGDGTTTTMVLTQAILNEGIKSTASPMDIKRSLDECLMIINDSLDKQTRQITVDGVANVGTISAEDEIIGKLLQEIYQQIGKEGIIELDNSNTADTYYVITEGVRLRNCGYHYQYMANDTKMTKATHLVPKILITKEKISTLQQIDHLFVKLSKQGITELVIFCDEIDPIVSTTLAQTQVQGLFKTLVIKAPTLWKDWLYDDFSKITGATIVEPSSGLKLKDVQLSHLGTCDKLITSKDETVVIGIHDIKSHIEKLKEEETDDAKLRLAWLQTKTAVIKLGANSESELSYKRLKLEDARNACYLALKEGVVAGGGLALLNCIEKLPQTEGGKILIQALKMPIHQIITNADLSSFNLSIKEDFGGEQGFDSKQRKLVNMFDAGIIDPVLVVKNSIKNAISVAGTVLTANVIITKPNETTR